MPATDIYQAVTDQLVEAIEAGAKSSGNPWLTMAAMPLRVTGEEYRGINALLLALTAAAKGYRNPSWLTFNQAKALGGMVRKGEKSSRVIFFTTLEREADNADGDPETRRFPMLREYRVFNVDQIDGLGDRFAVPTPADLPAKDRDDAAEAALRSTGADIAEDGGNMAFYRPSTDSIHLPAFALFRSTGCYLATLAHELIHWTGAKHRLAREGGSRFGDHAYAFEELVAEIGAAFTCARLGIAGDHINDHAAYLSSWLKALKGDKRFIFRAAAAAQTAADMVLANAADVDRHGPAKPAPKPTATRAALITAAPAAPSQAAFAF